MYVMLSVAMLDWELFVSWCSGNDTGLHSGQGLQNRLLWVYVCLMQAISKTFGMFQQEALPLSIRLQIRLSGCIIANPACNVPP